MQDYRAYILGPDDHVHDCVDLRCDDDGEAIRLAKQLVDGRDVKLWQLDRKIGTFEQCLPTSSGRAARTERASLIASICADVLSVKLCTP
jgi:hypothetical protein